MKKYGAKINLIDDEIDFNILHTNDLLKNEKICPIDLINLSDSPQNENLKDLNKIETNSEARSEGKKENEIDLKKKKKNKNYYENQIFAEKTKIIEEKNELKINK